MTHGTTSLGQFIEFQKAVLGQLPRPEDFDRAGIDIADWTNNQASMKRALASVFLPPLPIVHEPIEEFPVWKTVTIRARRNPSDYFKDIQGKRVGINQMAIDDCLDSPEFLPAQQHVNVELCKTTVEKLTGKNRVGFEEIFMAIRKVGHLCPYQVGPELRLEYEDQPLGDWLTIGMQPLALHGKLYSFNVFREIKGTLYLNRFNHESDQLYTGNQVFVFMKRRKK